MAIRRVLHVDDENDRKILQTPCRPVKLPDARLKQLIADMFETMYAFQGVGLAAPQIGLSIRVLVIGVPAVVEKQQDGTVVEVEPAEEYAFINPRIVKCGGSEIIRNEGCLSVPNWYGDVPRVTWVTVEYQEPNGKQRRMRKVDGMLGWILQHEIDHLDGVLFTERIRDVSTLRQITPEEIAQQDKDADEEGDTTTIAERAAA